MSDLMQPPPDGASQTGAHRFVPHDGARLAYTVRGSGPGLLLVHGIGLDGAWWDSQVRHFAERFRVVAPDLRGHGASVAAADSITLTRFAADLVAVVTAARCTGPVHVCGHSLGALVAVALAATRPELVRTLTLSNAWGYNPYTVQNADQLGHATERMSMAQVAAARAPLALAPGADKELAAELAAVLAAKNPATYLATAHVMWTADVRALGATVSVPTLVLAGEHDQIVAPRLSAELVSLIPGARLRTVPGSGHVPHLEDPSAFNHALDHFLTTASQAPTPEPRS